LPSNNSLLRHPLIEDNSATRKEKDINLKQRVGLVFSEEEEPTQGVNIGIEKKSILKNL
jgi:hypothetical protein